MTPKPAAHTPMLEMGNPDGDVYTIQTTDGKRYAECFSMVTVKTIVRAVNAHEELVSMLKGELLDRGDERRYTREEIKQAIAKAEGRDA